MAAMHLVVLGAVVMVMEANGCSTYTAAVEECVSAVRQFPPNADVAMICRMFNETRACMAAAAATCDNPPADSKWWTDMWASMDSTAQELCTHSPGDIANGCSIYTAAVEQCVSTIRNFPPNAAVAMMCMMFNETRACMAAAATTCDNPPADSKQWTDMWANMDITAQELCTHSPGDEANGCSTYTAAVQQCVLAGRQFPPNADVAMICMMFNETKACMAAAAATCDNPPEDSKWWTYKWDNVVSNTQDICSHSPDDTSCDNFEGQAATCMLDLMNEAGPGSSLDEVCQLFGEAKLCMDPLVNKCPAEAQGSRLNKELQWLNPENHGTPC